MKTNNIITPVILAGGSGTRLWPLSRKEKPKQFLKIFNNYSLFQLTIIRCIDNIFSKPIIIVGEDHRFIVAEQLKEIGIKNPTIILEPKPKNTTAAITIAAKYAISTKNSNNLLILPSDHYIKNNKDFIKVIKLASKSPIKNKLICFGIKPSGPETKYGYIVPNASEKKLIKDILSEQIPPTRTNKLIQTVEKRLQDNQLIISEIISEVNNSLMHWEVVEIVNNLYALISVDGIASTQEIEFLDKISESLHIDFQYKNEIKTKQLLNVDIEDDKTNFAILDIDFSAPENIQIQQAEDGIIKWNGRLNTLTDPKERTNAQNFINKYSEFIKQKRTSQNTNSQKKKLTRPSKTSSKWDLLEPLDFPIPPKSTSEEVNKIRKKHPRHRARWSVSEEEMLIKLYKENYSISQIASGLQRTDDAIENKIEKLKLI